VPLNDERRKTGMQENEAQGLFEEMVKATIAGDENHTGSKLEL